VTTRYDRLSALDESFLHLERLETPMHVTALTVFEGAPFFDASGHFRLAEIRELVASRLHLIPRFRKRLMNVPFGAGRPIWVDDDRFDIAYHVRLTALPRPGTRAQLLTLTERVQSQLLDRKRSLWELWFVEGLEGGHVALIQKTHHALVDGISGVDVATVLLDFEPEPTVLDAPPWEPAPEPDPADLLFDSITERFGGPMSLVGAVRNLLSAPRAALERAAHVVRTVSTLGTGGVVAPRTSLNASVGRHRRFTTVQVSLEDVKTVRRAHGGTINDVVLAGVGGGLRALLQQRGELAPDLTLKVFCPVSVRDESEHLRLGNRVSAMFVPLEVSAADPVERLRAVQATTAELKTREQAVGAAFLVGLTEYAVPTLLGLAARLVHSQPFFNLVVTNVPGPQVPLYCMGARMLEAYPIVPLAQNLTIGIAILSYCGQLHLGLLADRDRAPDLEVLAQGIEGAFTELTKIAKEREPGEGP
jgi:diacylglycerol O-acyltransferase / wax synthase